MITNQNQNQAVALLPFSNLIQKKSHALKMIMI